MKKKHIFLPAAFLSLAMLLCSCSKAPEPEEPVEETPDGYVDVLPENNDGNILQAFCWTFNQIKDNIPAIAEAGFKVVQTSPVQQPKSGGASWWAYYQPLSFSIADNSGLGTKEELRELCAKAEEYGVAVICDIVFNHLANINDDELEPDGTPKVSPAVAEYEPYIYEHRNDTGDTATFHHNPNAQGSGAVTQVYSYGHLPDLNTANPVVQERCLDLLKECIDVGVDGFRFDAAKHIETPDDLQYPSDFWPNTLGVAKEYYHKKTGKELIAYGEILDHPDGNRPISYYTKLMKVTDNNYITDINNGTIVKSAEKAANASYGKDTTANNLVTWVESHDTYTTTSSHIGDTKIKKEWAVISSRKDSVSMFLARPDDTASVGKIASYFFEDPTIGAINRFHNRFIHLEEEQSTCDTTYINERYNDTTKGAILVNFDTEVGEREVTFSHLGTGVYYDQISGTAITVRNNKAKVTFDHNAVIILTMSKNLPRVRITTTNHGMAFAGSLSFNVTVGNATASYYKINGGSAVNFEETTTITLGDVTDDDGMIKVLVHAANEQFTSEREYTFQKVHLIDGYFNVVNLNPNYLTDYELYYWHWKLGTEGTWAKEFTVQDGILLIDFSSLTSTSFLLAIFPKDYVVRNIHEWDKGVIKQTVDISIADNFFDASAF